MTLDDFERPKRTVVEKTFYGAHQKKMNEDRHILSAAKCRPMIIVSRNIRYMRIYRAGVPRGGRKLTISVHAYVRYFEYEHMFICYLLALCVAALRAV